MSDMMHSDEADLRAALNGDQEAFGRMYDRHSPVVLSLCRRHLWTEAEDAMQETFIRAYRKLDEVHDASKIRPWLYAIARWVCKERRRSAARRNKHEEAAMLKLRDESRAAPPVGPAESSTRAEQLARLGSAMERLSDDERLALHLYYLEDDPVKAAAEAIGISRSGFYKLLSRARDQLATHMREVKSA